MNTIQETSSELFYNESKSSVKLTTTVSFKSILCILASVWILNAPKVFAQGVGISETSIVADASSILELKSALRGFLLPRMSAVQRDAIALPKTGLLVYNTDNNTFDFYNGTAWITILNNTNGVNGLAGTPNRIVIGGTPTNPIVDIDATYAGQTSITTLGTITTGTWNATTVAIANGGTGATSVVGVKTNFGLENVDNTSDVNKPVSTATQNALDIETTNRSNADGAIQTELNTTQVGAGLNVDGTYIADGTTTYLKLAASLKDADNLLDAQLKTNTVAIATNVSGLATEIADRANGDATLSTSISNESTRATGVEGTLGTNQTAEVTNRTNADNAIQTELNVTNTGAGLNADGSYTADGTTNFLSGSSSLKDADNKLDSQIKLNTTAIATSVSGLATEIADRANGDAVLSTSISNENTRATGVEGTLTTNISGEIANRTSADATLQTALDLKAPLISPIFTTPSLGVATATSINGNTITAGSGTFTIAAGKTLNVIDDATVSGTNTGDQTTITGNAGTATKLATSRKINTVDFDGTSDITVTADANTLTGTTLNTTVVSSSLTSVGTLTGLTVTGTINGSVSGTASDVTSTIGIVHGGTGQTTSQGAINALAGTQTTGEYLRGNGTDVKMSAIQVSDVPVLNQSTTGNASTATKLASSRKINTVDFDGTSDITVTADANTLTGTTLNTTVVSSSLTSVGTLTGLTVTGTINGSVSGTASDVTSTIGIVHGGTGQTTSQGAINALAGTQTTGEYLRGNGTDVKMSAIQVSDVPILNQNTTGNASTATKLATSRKINTVDFDGTSDITVTADANTLTGTTLNTTVVSSSLTSVGTLTGLTVTGTINGSVSGTASDVTSTIGIVHGGTGQTTSQGAINALAGTQTTGEYLRGNGTDVKMSAIQVSDIPVLNQSTTGNASTATKLATSRKINTVDFDGTSDITVTADANTLTGTILNPTVVGSSLTSVGTLTGLTVTGTIIGSVSGTASDVTGTIGITHGGTGQTTSQGAINALAGMQTTGQYLRGDGTDVKMSAIQVSDVPVLNQSTTGNASTATKLATSRKINTVDFDGTSDITVTADANTLTGTILNPTIVGSSLTSVGTLTNLTVTNPIVGSVTGNAATVTTNANLTGDVNSAGNVTTLATVNTTTGTFGATTSVPTITVNGKGLVTASSSTAIAFPVTLAGTETLTNKTLTSPILVTPSLGVATVTSINGNIITSGSGTITLAAGKLLTTTDNATVSGTNTGDISLGGIGSSPNASGASLLGQVLTLQPADGTNGGIISNGTQTIAGSKTWNAAATFSAGMTVNGAVTINGAFNLCLDNSGINDTYTATNSSITGLVNGLVILFSPLTSNTTGCTLNLNGYGAKSITRQDGSTINSGDLRAGGFLFLVYSGSKWLIIGRY